MVKYNREKLEELILYIAMRSQDDPAFGSTRLAKALFWSDFEHFRETGDAITGATYVKMPYGPIPYGFPDFLQGMAGWELLRLDAYPWEKGEQKRPIVLREPNMDLFTSDEIALVDQIIAEHRGKSATQISNESHDFLGWQVARPRERIPYGTIWLSAPEPTEEERQRAAALAARLGRG